MASTSATLSISSTSTLIDTKPHRQPNLFSSLQCTTLPAPHLEQSQQKTWKTTAYCRKLARNVITMASGEAPATTMATAEAPAAAEVAPTTATATATATGEAPATEDVTTEMPDIVKTVQAAWDKLEDKYAVTSLGVAGVVALWGSSGLISAIDRLPLVPGVMELVGIGYSGWFAYKNLVFKPDREALFAKIKGTYNDILGSS